MYLEQRIALEEAESERKFQASLNLVEKLADDPLYYCLTLAFLSVIMFDIGFLIGTLL
jgi:hypothetical protein